METILEILLLSIIIIYGNTISGFGTTLQDRIWQMWLFPKYPKTVLDKPFFCSLCLTFWVGLGWLLYRGEFTLINVVLVCGISYLTDVTESVIRLIKDYLIKILDFLYSYV